MQCGDDVTWREFVRTTSRAKKRVRYTTGVITSERVRDGKREFEIAVRWLSGNLPAKPKGLIWVREEAILIGRSSRSQHVSKVSPFELLKRRHREELRRVEAGARAMLDAILANVTGR